jgi:hypothetical protein
MAGFYGSRKDYRQKAARIPGPEGPSRVGEFWAWLVIRLALLVAAVWLLARLFGWA